jgi:hypothetical protein
MAAAWSAVSVAPALPATPKTSESPEIGGLFTPVQLAPLKRALVLPTQVSAPFAARTEWLRQNDTAITANKIRDEFLRFAGFMFRYSLI